jgi:hypothetical protein
MASIRVLEEFRVRWPPWELAVHSGCMVKSVLALVRSSPTPTMAISEMPTGESQGHVEA